MSRSRHVLLLCLLGACDDASTVPDAGLAPDARVGFDAEPDADQPPPDAQPDAAAADAPVPAPDAALPDCANGLDDDGDGLVDFPIDPGCASREDLDERDRPAPPVCANGLDDDQDGRADLSDPGCVDGRDEDERDPATPPGCANGVDDDGDLRVDYPEDPGCVGAGDADEADPDPAPACANGLDDDEDGWADYPEDPGCAARSDADEQGPTRACANGEDDDRDGQIDYPDDFGCAAAGDDEERAPCGALSAPIGVEVASDLRRGGFDSAGACGGRAGREAVFLVRFAGAAQALVFQTLPGTEVDHVLYVRRQCDIPGTELACDAGLVRVEDPEPGDYYAVVDGITERGGPVRFRADVIALQACRNGADDDGDGRVDYPDDPGCAAPEDGDEASPEPLPACADGVDNDGDVLIDFPADVGCNDAADDDEGEPCGQGVRVLEVGPDERLAAAPASDALGGFCGGFDNPEWIARWHNPAASSVTFEVTPPGQAVYLRTDCRDLGSEVGCGTGLLRIEDLPAGDYFVVVEGAGALEVRRDRRRPGCDDGQDNDLDGLVDADDPGCADAADGDERDGEPTPCGDGVDNDGDGLVDWPADPGCGARGGPTEVDPPEPPACANGFDDDGDGAPDFPRDLGCAAPGDRDEAAAVARVECSNGEDDDGDQRVDWPFDPGCAGPGDLSETTDVVPACSNGIDDDRDGRVDWPADPGCRGAGDTETGRALACADGLDNDRDGNVDFPVDPGCEAAGDDDEADPIIPPRCANRVDDDRDGRRDWGEDPGCAYPADDDESGPATPACADGFDNDADGRIDLADPGCVDGRDAREADPGGRCANGLDDDGDGQIDWPADPGCGSAGDVCEQAGFGECGGCVDLQDDPQNCGRCGRRCADCLGGRCGGLRAFAGVRRDVPDAHLPAWQPCYRGRFSEGGPPLSDLAFDCVGELLLIGCRPVGADRWSVLAMGAKGEVLRDTGRGAHAHNGVLWYLAQDGSMGFAPGDAVVRRRPCDVEAGDGRLCWLTDERRIAAGGRCALRTRLTGADSWERAVWSR